MHRQRSERASHPSARLFEVLTLLMSGRDLDSNMTLFVDLEPKKGRWLACHASVRRLSLVC